MIYLYSAHIPFFKTPARPRVYKRRGIFEDLADAIMAVIDMDHDSIFPEKDIEYLFEYVDDDAPVETDLEYDEIKEPEDPEGEPILIYVKKGEEFIFLPIFETMSHSKITTYTWNEVKEGLKEGKKYKAARWLNHAEEQFIFLRMGNSALTASGLHPLVGVAMTTPLDVRPDILMASVYNDKYTIYPTWYLEFTKDRPLEEELWVEVFHLNI